MEVTPATCPASGMKGKVVKTVTLKALLTPQALATLEPREQHHFCPDPEYSVVYFGPSDTYRADDLKTPVFQKDPAAEVPVCSCFARVPQIRPVFRTGESNQVNPDWCGNEEMTRIEQQMPTFLPDAPSLPASADARTAQNGPGKPRENAPD